MADLRTAGRIQLSPQQNLESKSPKVLYQQLLSVRRAIAPSLTQGRFSSPSTATQIWKVNLQNMFTNALLNASLGIIMSGSTLFSYHRAKHCLPVLHEGF